MGVQSVLAVTVNNHKITHRGPVSAGYYSSPKKKHGGPVSAGCYISPKIAYTDAVGVLPLYSRYTENTGEIVSAILRHNV